MPVNVKRFAFVILLLCMAGCVTSNSVPIDPRDETLSLVYGYFDMKDAPSDLQWVSIKKDDIKPQYYAAGVKNGLFWHVGIGSGAYQVETFGGQGGLLARPFKYNFGTRGKNNSAIKAANPGVYFMGAYVFVEFSGGILGTDRFDMRPTKTPTEKELLQRLIVELESHEGLRIYARQITRAKTRLAELSR